MEGADRHPSAHGMRSPPAAGRRAGARADRGAARARTGGPPRPGAICAICARKHSSRSASERLPAELETAALGDRALRVAGRQTPRSAFPARSATAREDRPSRRRSARAHRARGRPWPGRPDPSRARRGRRARDRDRARPALRRRLARARATWPRRLEVLEADALASIPPGSRRSGSSVVANLPYNIGTALLLKWLDQIERVRRRLTLMFQREVAERLAAAPGSGAYGRLSVIVQWLCEVRDPVASARSRLRAAAAGGFERGRSSAAPAPAGARGQAGARAVTGRGVRSAAQDAPREPQEPRRRDPGELLDAPASPATARAEEHRRRGLLPPGAELERGRRRAAARPRGTG